MNIKPLLKQKDISQRELARRLNVNVSYVNGIMKEGVMPRFSTVCAISETTGIPLEEIKNTTEGERENERKENKDSSGS